MRGSFTNFKPACMPIAIGSVPLADPQEAMALVRRYSSEDMFWPQLPARGFREGMIAQYAAGMPGIVVDEAEGKVTLVRGKSFLEELTAALEKVLSDDIAAFPMEEDSAAGFAALGRMLDADQSLKPIALKGQVTGPVTFGLMVTDEEKKPLIYDDGASEVILRCLGMKARWQASRFSTMRPEAVRIVFLDEPYLTQIGSAMMGVQPDQAIGYINECLSMVDGLTGIHVCGKTDWALVFSTDVDIVHFDAYDFADAMVIYAAEIKAHLASGGYMAWGIVPTDNNVESFDGIDAPLLAARLEPHLDALEASGIGRRTLLERSFLSPSCGTGSMSVADAEKCFSLVLELSGLVRAEYDLTAER